MLLTNEKASLKLGQNGLLVNNTFGYDSHQYLSDEEIKDGDMCINSFDNKIWRYKTIPCPLPYWGNKKRLLPVLKFKNVLLILSIIKVILLRKYQKNIDLK